MTVLAYISQQIRFKEKLETDDGSVAKKQQKLF